MNSTDARYCTGCGFILQPIYCSSCGSINPIGLPGCLECGNRLPENTSIRWGPLVKVVRPTSAMAEDKLVDKSNQVSIITRLRSRLKRSR